MPAVSIEDTPTEPATSPRVTEVPVQRWAQELQLPTLEHGPREEPERFATRYILNDGTMTQETYDALLRKAAQTFNNQDMERELDDAMAREYEAHQRSIKEWEARVTAQELKDHHDIPRGPPPAGTSSMRALPDVHAALRQNDPSKATHSQPVVKKAPPSTGRPMPAGFYSDKEPPRIGTLVQPPPPATSRPDEAQGLNLPLAATPMTPSHPPRPPIEALPKHPSMETSSGANSIHLSNQHSKVLRTSMFDQRLFHMDSCLHRRHLWQHPQQLICPGRARHAQKVLRQSTCQHLLRLHQRQLVLKQLFESRM